MIYSNHGGIIPMNESWFKKNKNRNNHKSNNNIKPSNINNFYATEEENEIVDKAVKSINEYWPKIKEFVNKEININSIYKKYIEIESNISRNDFENCDIYKGKIQTDSPVIYIYTLKDNPDIKYHAKDISENEALAGNFIGVLCNKLNNFVKSNNMNIIFEDDGDADWCFINLYIPLNALDLSFPLKNN